MGIALQDLDRTPPASHSMDLHRFARLSGGFPWPLVAASMAKRLLVALSVTVGLAAMTSGCATRPQTGIRAKGVSQDGLSPGGVDPRVKMVVRTLRQRGLEFGTDGSMGSLFAYARHSLDAVPPERARAGDLVFFDTTSRGKEHRNCGDHVGIIEDIRPDGALTFREYRNGARPQSQAHPR